MVTYYIYTATHGILIWPLYAKISAPYNPAVPIVQVKRVNLLKLDLSGYPFFNHPVGISR